MQNLLYFLSGEVPGGLLLLFFLFSVINLALYFLFKGSKLFSKEVYQRKAIRANIFLFSIYIILWIVFKPVELPDQILILPFQDEDGVEYVLCESLQKELKGNLRDGLSLYQWEWFYQTANKDSLHLREYRENLSKKIGIEFILSGVVSSFNDHWQLQLGIAGSHSLANFEVRAESYPQLVLKTIKLINQEYSILNKNYSNDDYLNKQKNEIISRAKVALLDDLPDEVLTEVDKTDSGMVEVITAAYLLKGIEELAEDPISPLYDDLMNRNFRQLLNMIIPFSKIGADTPEMNITLARMYLHTGNYGMAEVCLEKALTQGKYNPRVYYYLSFLHKSRFQERGFDDRVALLDHVVRLDPGYTLAVYELADELYRTGTAAPTHPNTERSIQILRQYLQINPNKINILSLMGRILLQAKYTEEAMEIYTKLLQQEPETAENHYNLGICNFHLKKYDQAEKLFLDAIKMNDYANAYLYIGVMYRLGGDNDKALYYYRERVKRKQSDDDQYAIEAMHGIRLILNDIAIAEENEKKIKDPDTGSK